MNGNNQNKLPQSLLLFIITCPLLCLIMIFLGIAYQMINPLNIWIAIVTVISIPTFIIFIKKKRLWTRHYFMGLSLLFVILLFNSAIELPLMFTLPVFIGLRIFLFSLFIYFAIMFTIFLSDIELLDYYKIIGKESDELRINKINKAKKWKKIFGISLISLSSLFLATGTYMSFVNKLNYSESNSMDIKKLIYENLTKITENMREFKINDVETVEINFHSIILKIPKTLKYTHNPLKIIIYSEKDNKSNIIATYEVKPYFSNQKDLIQQILLMRYIYYARNGIKNIKANIFQINDYEGYGLNITAGDSKEIITTKRIKNGTLIMFFSMDKNNIKNLAIINLKL